MALYGDRIWANMARPENDPNDRFSYCPLWHTKIHHWITSYHLLGPILSFLVPMLAKSGQKTAQTSEITNGTHEWSFAFRNWCNVPCQPPLQWKFEITDGTLECCALMNCCNMHSNFLLCWRVILTDGTSEWFFIIMIWCNACAELRATFLKSCNHKWNIWMVFCPRGLMKCVFSIVPFLKSSNHK